MSIIQGSGDSFSSAHTTVDLSNSEYLQIAADYGIYAVPSAGEVVVNILLTINAPKAPDQKERQPVAVVLVIDKSGSMSDRKKLEYAKIAGKALVGKLEPRDKMSIVVFDADVNVLFPIASVTNKQHIEKMIDLIRPGSTTNISGGLEAGLNQIETTKLSTKRVILLSDGQANVGIQHPEGIAAIAAAHRVNGVSVSSVGLGLDYNENLMQLLAQRGGGMYYYCGEAVDLSNVFDNELSLAKNTVTRRTSAIYTPPSDNRCIIELKFHGLPTKKQGNETKIDVSDLTSEEERQILLQITVDPSVAVNREKTKEKEKEKQKEKDSKKTQSNKDKTKDQESVIEQHILSLGEFRIQFSRTEGGAAEQIEIPLSIIIDDDEDRRDLINGDEQNQNQNIAGEQTQTEANGGIHIGSGGRNHVQSIERVTEFVMTAEADAARTRAVEEMERGNSVGARFILNQHRQRQLAVQQAAFVQPAYLGLGNDLNQQIKCEEQQSSHALRLNSSDHFNKAKTSVPTKLRGFAAQLSSFLSKKAPETAIPQTVIQQQQQRQQSSSYSQLPKTKMFMANSRSSADVSKHHHHIRLGQKMKKYSNSNSKSRQASIDNEESSGNESDHSDDDDQQVFFKAHSQSPPNQPGFIQFKSIQSMSSVPQMSSIRQIPTIPKPTPIQLLPPEQQNTIQGNLNRALFMQQQGLDELEQQLGAAEGNSAMQNHLRKQNQQRSYSHAQGQNSSAASATASSSTTCEPHRKK